MSSYSEGQIHQLADRLESEGFTPDEVTKLGQYRDFPGIRELVNGRAKIMPVAPEVQETIDTIIRVNRSVRPAYPDWVDKDWINAEKFLRLELTGPAEYDISVVKQWLHNKQKSGVEGKVIYEHLKETDALKDCLGLADLLAIQVKGSDFFRKYFSGKAVFGWKSFVRHRLGGLFAPCLVEGGDRVLLDWGWLGRDWGSGRPALRFAS